MASRSKYLSNVKMNSYEDFCNICEILGNVIHIIKNRKIRTYWVKNTGKQKNVDELWELFYHCVCMSIDRDVEEYINCLKANKKYINCLKANKND